MAGQRSGGGRSGGGRSGSRSGSGRSGGGRSGSSRSSSGRARSEGGRSSGSSPRHAAGDGRGGRTRARQGQAPDGRRDDRGRHEPEVPEPRRQPRGRGRGRGQGSLRGLVSVLVVVVIVLGCYLAVSCANKGDEAEEETSTVTITEASSDDEDTADADATTDADSDSSDTDESDADDSDTTATSFLERVTELQATYGEATVVEADEDGVPLSYVSGLAVALLVDVQGDGESELLLAYLTDASSEWPYLAYAVEVWGSTTGSDELELLCSGTLVYPYGSPCIHIVDLSGSQIVYWASYDDETDADLGYYVTPADFGEVVLHETRALTTFTSDTDYSTTYSVDGTEVDQETYEAYATTYDIYGNSHDVEYVYLDGSEDTVTLTQETIASLS